MIEKSQQRLDASIPPNLASLETIKKIVTGNRTLLSLIAITALSTACGGNAFETSENPQDAGTNQPLDSSPDNENEQDATLDTHQDAPLETTTHDTGTPDSTQEDSNTSDAGCQGTLITPINMKGYEILHTGDDCNDIKLNTAANNETLETGPITLCIEQNDKLVLFVYDPDNNNNVTGTSTAPFNPDYVIRGGANMDTTVPDSNFMLTRCIQEMEHGSTCIPTTIFDTDPNDLKFEYFGAPNCIGGIGKTANTYFMAMTH